MGNIDLSLYQKTGSTKKIIIDKEIKELEIYKIPLEMLKYNMFNGRISTWLSDYESKNKTSIDLKSREEFNKIIEEGITLGNEDTMRKTKDNIALAGQLEVGVISSDGVVIDGNRRFTCLRKLNREKPDDERFKYFETVVLNYDSSNKKIMKSIELQIQMGKEERVDYDAIDKLVDIYKCIVEEQIFTVEEYAKYVGIKEQEAKSKLEEAYIMDDYLTYIGMPKQWHYAKDKKLQGSFLEIKHIKNWKIGSEMIKNQLLNIVFDYLLISPKNDMGKFIRNDFFKKIKESDDDDIQKFIDQHEKNISEPFQKIRNSLDNQNSFEETITKQNSNSGYEFTRLLSKNIENLAKANEIKKLHKKQIAFIEECLEIVNRIDINEVNNIYSDEDVDNFRKLCFDLNDVVKEIISKIRN